MDLRIAAATLQGSEWHVKALADDLSDTGSIGKGLVSLGK